MHDAARGFSAFVMRNGEFKARPAELGVTDPGIILGEAGKADGNGEKHL